MGRSRLEGHWNDCGLVTGEDLHCTCRAPLTVEDRRRHVRAISVLQEGLHRIANESKEYHIVLIAQETLNRLGTV